MATIPKLNLAKELTPEQVASILNRWADNVTTALNEVSSHTNATNRLTNATKDIITSNPIVTTSPTTGNMQQQKLVSNSPKQLPVPGPAKLVTQDHLVDGTTYARVVASDQTSNRIDFSKSLLNKQLDNIPDGTTYNRFKAANMFSGGASPAHVSTQLPTINPNTTTVVDSFSGVTMASGWKLVSSVSITIPPGINSITFKITTAFTPSGTGSFAPFNSGLAIYSGSAPSTPQVSGALTLGTTLAVPSPPSGNVTLGVYVNSSAGTNATVQGAIGIPTVLVINPANIT